MSGGVYPVFPCQHPADYDFVQPDGFGDQYDFQRHCVYVGRRRPVDCGDYFQREHHGAGIEDYRDGGFDLFRILQTRDERGQDVGFVSDYRIHRPLVDDRYFVIIILMSSFHTNMARVVPGDAAIYFCLVVILTMLSAYYFDPRLIWGKQQQLSDGLDSDQTLKQ